MNLSEKPEQEQSHYVVIRQFHLKQVINAVNTFRDDNPRWRCAGGVSYIDGMWTQALERAS